MCDELKSFIDKAKSKRNKPSEFIDDYGRVYELYEEIKTLTNLIDFQDMISMVVDLLEKDKEKAKEYQQR